MNARPIPKPQKPSRDRGYMTWLVTNHRCLFCGQMATQAHHVRWAAPCGASQKPDDYATIPVCHICHDAVHSMCGSHYESIVAMYGREEIQAAMIRYLIGYIQKPNKTH